MQNIWTDPREPLPEGTVLRCGAAEYRISGAPIGRGGSSIVYPVLRAGENSRLAVKEGFPLLPDEFGAQRIARVAGIAAPAAPGDAAARDAMRRLAQSLRQEKEISQRISGRSARAVELREQLGVTQIVLPDGTAYDGQAGLFFLMDDISGKGMSLPQLLSECALAPAPGHPLRTGGLPAPAVSAAILSTGARAAELVTACGYLHGDIQLYNLLLLDARADGTDVGFGALLDYSCARPFEADGLTAPVVRREAFSTPGFTPPELALGKGETVRLGPQADVYSLGRLLLYLLTGQTFYERRYDGSGYDSLYGDPGLRTLRPSEARRLGVRGGALRLLNHILLRALDDDPEKRYPTPAALRADAERLAAALRAPGLSLAPSLPHSPGFCARPALFSALRALADRANPLWLCGEAGMGKTELAVRFGEYLQEKQNRPVCLVRYEGSLRDALLCADIRGTAPDAGGADQPDSHAPVSFPADAGLAELEKTLCTLEREFDGCLLIVDGFFDKDRTLAQLQREPAYRLLRAHPGIQVLFTTRYAVPADSVTVGPMTDAELLTVLHAGQRAYGSGELSFCPDEFARDAADPYRQPRPEP